MPEFTTSETNSLSIYLDEIRKIPRLTVDEEVALATRIAAGRAAAAQLQREPPADPAARAALQAQLDDAQEARHQLTQANLGLVASVAQRYRCEHLTLLDLIQEGNIGLMRAVEKFNPTAGRFSTYATWWIRQGIIRALERQGRIIRLPNHAWTARRKARRVAAHLWQAFEREPTAEEIAAEGGQSLKRLRSVLAAPDTCSLSAPLKRADQGRWTIEEAVADPQATLPEEAVEQRELRETLARALASLLQRERRVLELRYGLGNSERLTYEEIGAELGISHQYAYQLEQRALSNLRRAAPHDLGVLLGHPAPACTRIELAPVTPGAKNGAGEMCKICTSSPAPKLPKTLPPGLPRGFPAVFAALSGAATMEKAVLASGYASGHFYRIVADAWKALGLPGRRRRQYTPAQLAQELAKALRRPRRARAA